MSNASVVDKTEVGCTTALSPKSKQSDLISIPGYLP